MQSAGIVFVSLTFHAGSAVMISNIDEVLDAPTLLSGYGQSQSRRAARGSSSQALNATCQHHAVQGRLRVFRPSVVYTEEPEACNAAWQRQRMTTDCWMIWRRGWDLNPRMEVLQTSPLGLLGTAPGESQYSGIGRACQGDAARAWLDCGFAAGPSGVTAAPWPLELRGGSAPTLRAAWDRCRSRCPTRSRPPW